MDKKENLAEKINRSLDERRKQTYGNSTDTFWIHRYLSQLEENKCTWTHSKDSATLSFE